MIDKAEVSFISLLFVLSVMNVNGMVSLAAFDDSEELGTMPLIVETTRISFGSSAS